MCDYSLHHVKSRPAKVGDKLRTVNFNTGTRGFASPDDRTTAVCVLPGTELAFSKWNGASFREIQVKTVRAAPWYVSRSSFDGDMRNDITIYVLLGSKTNQSPARFFIARNSDVAVHATYPKGWPKNGFMPFKALEQYENNWRLLHGNEGRGRLDGGAQATRLYDPRGGEYNRRSWEGGFTI
jgi:hypothetical protein